MALLQCHRNNQKLPLRWLSLRASLAYCDEGPWRPAEAGSVAPSQALARRPQRAIPCGKLNDYGVLLVSASHICLPVLCRQPPATTCHPALTSPEPSAHPVFTCPPHCSLQSIATSASFRLCHSSSCHGTLSAMCCRQGLLVFAASFVHPAVLPAGSVLSSTALQPLNLLSTDMHALEGTRRHGRTTRVALRPPTLVPPCRACLWSCAPVGWTAQARCCGLSA